MKNQSKKHTLLISGQTGQNLCWPFMDKNSSKTILFGTRDTYIAHIRKKPLPPTSPGEKTLFKTLLERRYGAVNP